MAKKTYVAASLIKLKDKTFRPGEQIEGISTTEETELLTSGMIYEVPNAKSRGSVKESKKIKELEEECVEKELLVKRQEETIFKQEETIAELEEKVKALEMAAKATDGHSDEKSKEKK